MPLIRALLTMLACVFALMAGRAHAQTFGSCTVATASSTLGPAGSFTVATTAQQGSGSSGLGCSAISVATNSYLKVKLESSTFTLVGPGGRTVPFIVSAAPNGTAITTGAEADFSSFDLLHLFTGPGGTVPLYFRTTPTSGLASGTYQGSVNLRWYFSVCTLGVAVCLALSESPGFVRPGLFTTLAWGTGVPVTINVSLTVDKDCAITAPDVDFGTVALVSQFTPKTRTISIRCSADASYTVGLSNGDNYAGGSRRMKLGSNYLRYELYQGTSGSTRWGPSGSERRSSGAADTNPGLYDGSTLQGFTYRAIIDPGQATPTAGRYTDIVLVDVVF